MTESLFAFLTLTLMEIILGVDNIIFIAIQVSKLPRAQQFTGRSIGLAIALIFRVMLLLSLSWVMSLVAPLFELFNHAFSGKDLLLLAGGLFLVAKATSEIHHKLENPKTAKEQNRNPSHELTKVILQVAVIDIIFSLDSIITAVGMTQNIPVMVAAVTASMIIMTMISGKIADFIERHPTIKMLALAFLIMIGVMLLMEGMSVPVNRNYLYFAMFFALAVEGLNMTSRKKRPHE